MRKTGIYIVLGITISLSIFIFAGVLYFRPALREAAPMIEPPVAKEAPAALPVKEPMTAKVPQKPEEPVVPSGEPEVVEEIVLAEEPVAVPEEAQPVPVEPEGQVVEKPVSEEVPPPIPAPPLLRMTVSSYEAPEPQVSADEPAVIAPEEELAVVEETEEVRPVEDTGEVRAVEEESKEPTEEQLEGSKEQPEQDRVIEPEIHDRPVLRVPGLPTVPTSIKSVMPFTRPAPVEYIWTPVTIGEGPTEHVDPVTFSKEAFERRRIAVDEVLENLIWE